MLKLTTDRTVDVIAFWPELKRGIGTPLFEQCKRDLLQVFNIDLRVPLFGWDYLSARVNPLYILGSFYEVTRKALEEGPESFEWYRDNDKCVEMATYIMSPLVAITFSIHINDVYIVEVNSGNHYVVGLTPRGPFFDFQFGQHPRLVPTGRSWKRNEFLESETFRRFAYNAATDSSIVPKYTDLTPETMEELRLHCEKYPDCERVDKH